jgi:hypothetical protein
MDLFANVDARLVLPVWPHLLLVDEHSLPVVSIRRSIRAASTGERPPRVDGWTALDPAGADSVVLLRAAGEDVDSR